MKRYLTSIGCYCVIVVILVGSIASLATTPSGRVILGIIFGIVGLVVIVCTPHNLRIWRVRNAYKNLPKNIKERVLDLIKEAAAKNPSITNLLLDDEPCSEPETAISSRVGGLPYAEKDETWSIHSDSVPPRFLLQVRLDEPEPW